MFELSVFFCLYTVWTFAMDFEHFNNIARNSLKQQNLQKIKSDASNLDDVLTFRVNSALKKEFSKICKNNQSSASSELKRYMLKIVEQGSLYFNRSVDEFEPHLLS